MTAEAPDVPSEHVLLSSSGRGWSGVDAAELIYTQDDFALPAIPRHVLVVNLASPFDAKKRARGREGYISSSGIVVLPAGAPREKEDVRIETFAARMDEQFLIGTIRYVNNEGRTSTLHTNPQVRQTTQAQDPRCVDRQRVGAAL